MFSTKVKIPKVYQIVPAGEGSGGGSLLIPLVPFTILYPTMYHSDSNFKVL